ncbi:MAG: cytochrome c [Phycisphaerae bacterium]|jgi:mono/diheme cytochrome c family protein
MRKRVLWIVLSLVAVAAVPPLLILRARWTPGLAPRVHIVPDMDNQPKRQAQQTSPFFADTRAMRPPVVGTVAVSEWPIDEHLQLGKKNGEWATTFPMPLTMDVMRRGQQRFGVFCAPCHGSHGFGDGLVNSRAEALAEGTWVTPTSFHTDEVRGRAVGELFDFITNGVRTMPAYGVQIPVPDRWAIVAYLRALQRSEQATIQDVPSADREDLK